MKEKKCAEIFKALANEQRLKLFLLIAENCCGKKEGFRMAFTKGCECLNISRSTVSHHLKELQRAGLIIRERDGQMQCCRVNEQTLKLVKSILP